MLAGKSRAIGAHSRAGGGWGVSSVVLLGRPHARSKRRARVGRRVGSTLHSVNGKWLRGNGATHLIILTNTV